jgi:hypothetical protein
VRVDAHPITNPSFSTLRVREENITMSDDEKLKSSIAEEALAEDEKEFRALRQDLPGVSGASAVGMVTIGVNKIPGKNMFFRTHPDFRPVIPIVDLEVGMEKQYFAVTPPMVEALAGIGISVTNHVLYLTVTSQGSVRIVPVRCANSDGEQNEYARTKEIGLRAGIEKWVRLYTDQENKCYCVFPAPVDRFADPVWPELSQAKIFKLGFRDKGRLVDSTEHPLFLKWAARDRAK